MSKHSINIFNISIYKQILNQYNLNLNALGRYNSIYEKMDGYYTKDEMHYIVEVYVNQLIDIINSKNFSLFVPEKARREINIKSIFFVDVEYPEQ